MPSDLIRVGTRGSKLALIQTHSVIDALRERRPGVAFEKRIIKTTGDRVTGVPLSQIGTVGLFTKEIETALLGRKIDIAVHSAKDVPTALPDGLRVEIIFEREDPRDVLVLRSDAADDGGPDGRAPLDALVQSASVGTGSERRKAQLLHHRPDLRVAPLRGNLDTRLRKLETEGLDAIVLAAAGLARMGADVAHMMPLPVDLCIPAAGQGALAVEYRDDDDALAELVAALQDETTVASVTAERAALATLGSGCQVPIGLHARVANGALHLRGVVAEPGGRQLVYADRSGEPGDAQGIGADVGRELLERGARDLMERPEGAAEGGS